MVNIRIYSVYCSCNVSTISTSLEHHFKHNVICEIVRIWLIIIFSTSFNFITPIIPFLFINYFTGCYRI
ncbi:hypothetical protein PBCV1_a269R [Paramecium bursaria Chlorella virus 1]|uniref:Uncharacterized protein n=1 Tax=Paramecium bursaria Chlorella virus 1 TaxID=10506 RepID=Q84586_PBCV1|nr:hypothetical protein PBCV1_a269R [Paramecium bursaria Chlorella virus 1]AAC96637.1 hypothetical protein [Paramecium bursaria Chlorella virus 1]